MNVAATVTPIHSPQLLYVREGLGFRRANPHEVIAEAETLIRQRYRPGELVLDLPRRTASFLHIHLGSQDQKVFGILHLDAEDRLIEAEDLFRGTLDAVSVHPREVVKSVLAHRSASIIFYENVPSGGSKIPQPEILRCCRLQSLMALMEVRVRDHLIVGRQVFSLEQAGYLQADDGPN
jgi:DNA repair protein RadC